MMGSNTYTKLFPQIDFNMDVCRGAMDCGKCLQVCQPHVMRCYTQIPEGHTTSSKEWIPIATYPSLCTGEACMKCVKVCPQPGAISITFKPMRMPRKDF